MVRFILVEQLKYEFVSQNQFNCKLPKIRTGIDSFFDLIDDIIMTSVHSISTFSTLPDVILNHVCSYLEGEELCRLSLCSIKLRDITLREELWQKLCKFYGLTQQSVTRTRGQKPWKSVFLANLCVECRRSSRKGFVTINTNVRQPELSVLCATCVEVISPLSVAERVKVGLPRLKCRDERVWYDLLKIVPYQRPKVRGKSSKNKGKKSTADELGVFYNDGLVKKLIR